MRKDMIAVGAGIGLVLISAVMDILDMVDTYLTTMVLVSGAVLLVIAMVRRALAKGGDVIRDERTNAIHNRAMAFSWWIAYMTLLTAYLLHHYGVIALSVEGFVPIMFFGMLLTYWITRSHLSYTGDVV